MGRKDELTVNVPSFFRCPISLDVMKSPVSLSTGVTYDRTSIQRWLDNGNNTCPATMQVLPSKDFVPNHTLHRLIQQWSSQSHHHHHHQQQPSCNLTPTSQIRILAHDLLRDLQSSLASPLPSLQKLIDLVRDSGLGSHELLVNAGCIPALSGILLVPGQELEILEAAITVLALVLDCTDATAVDKSLANSQSIASLLSVLRNGSSLSFRVDAAKVLVTIASADAEHKLLIVEQEGMLRELLRLGTEESDPTAVEAGLACLVAISSPRRVRTQIARLGAVTALGQLLTRSSTTTLASERTLKLLEVVSMCTEGRQAICEDVECVSAIVERMMKVSKTATESAVVILWSLCHLFRNRRAQEAVTASNGLTKLLLLMQSNCSPTVRQMSGDLLKIFRVNSKSCLSSYDTKTTHIMPF